jgi:hypothetical protein
MDEERPWKRVRDRLKLQLPVRVHVRETVDFEWIEVTRLTNVTPFGAGFTLKRPTERGRLLHMTIPMPRQLRVFDHVEDQYRVWAIVRHLRAVESSPDKPPLFEVGVAFIGKRPPPSYEADPTKRFSVATTLGERLTLNEVPEPVSTSADQRVHTRHNIPVDMLLELLDDKAQVAQSENTVTENISFKGATLFTTLPIPIGRFIRLTSPEYNTRVHAVVRARKTPADGIPRLHVEFIDREWPL